MIDGCAVVESSDLVLVSFDLGDGGVASGDVALDLSHGVLRVRVSRGDGRWLERTALVPEDAVTDAVDAALAGDVLTVTLHKRRPAQDQGTTMTRPLSVVTAWPARKSRPASLEGST